MSRLCIILFAAICACDVGSVLTTDGGGSSRSGDAPGGIDNTTCQNGSASPAAPHMHADGTGNHAGEACLTACHGTGAGGAPIFAFGGTVWVDASATTGKAGVAVRIKTGNNTQSVYSDMAGNFYIEGAPALTFPSNANITACPSLDAMSNALTAGTPIGGDCNGCHSKTPPSNGTTPMSL